MPAALLGFFANLTHLQTTLFKADRDECAHVPSSRRSSFPRRARFRVLSSLALPSVAQLSFRYRNQSRIPPGRYRVSIASPQASSPSKPDDAGLPEVFGR
jgi:hypothetical protein